MDYPRIKETRVKRVSTQESLHLQFWLSSTKGLASSFVFVAAVALAVLSINPEGNPLFLHRAAKGLL
jgi:hypothetical protein